MLAARRGDAAATGMVGRSIRAAMLALLLATTPTQAALGNVYLGTAIDRVLTDHVCCSWEGFRACATGAAARRQRALAGAAQKA